MSLCMPIMYLMLCIACRVTSLLQKERMLSSSSLSQARETLLVKIFCKLLTLLYKTQHTDTKFSRAKETKEEKTVFLEDIQGYVN